MNAIKVEPASDEESLSMSSHSEEELLTDIKHEIEPVPEPFCIVKTEAYVSYINRYFASISKGIHGAQVY
jgi:hypothetical protein